MITLGDSSLAAWLLCRARRASTFCVFCSAWRKPVSSRGSFSISATGFLPPGRAQVTAIFMAAAPLSTALGSPVSAALLEMHGFLGYAGWQWMFVLEALPALVLGVVVLFFLTDRPAKAKWLTDQERASAGKRHARRGAGTGGKTEPFQRMARASGYTRPGAGAGLFRYLSRAVYAWHLVPANHSQFRCFLAGDWFPERLSGGDRRHRHDPLGASFRSNQRAQLARHWRLPAGGCRADIRR